MTDDEKFMQEMDTLFQSDEDWVESWREVESKPEAPKPQAAPAVKREPSPAELDKIYAEASSEGELHARLREAGVPMSYDGAALDAEGNLDPDAARYDASGNPVNRAAWDAYRRTHPEYTELESGEAKTVVDGIGRAVRTYE